jgi:hypothetical protein
VSFDSPLSGIMGQHIFMPHGAHRALCPFNGTFRFVDYDDLVQVDFFIDTNELTWVVIEWRKME